MSLKYLEVEISHGNLKTEAEEQTMEAAQIAGCLKDLVWRNQHMSKGSKMRTYKIAV